MGGNPIKKWRLPIIISIIFLLLLLFIQLHNQKSTGEETQDIDTDIKSGFSPQTLPSGSESHYDIDLKMNKDEGFQAETIVKVKNTSEDSWEELKFYFIPNIFTEESSEHLDKHLEVPANVRMDNVLVEDNASEFTLEKDTLTVSLDTTVQPGNEVEVAFSYQFTLPTEGLRFTRNKENHYLAQFYPMLATYRDHKWNKEEYRLKGETYHTGFSDFNVTYDIQDGYTFVSTGDDEEYPGKNVGKTQVNSVGALKN